MGIQQVPDPGKTPLHSARFAPARLPEPATSPRPALCAHSCAKLAAIGACRQDVVQISLTLRYWGRWHRSSVPVSPLASLVGVLLLIAAMNARSILSDHSLEVKT